MAVLALQSQDNLKFCQPSSITYVTTVGIALKSAAASGKAGEQLPARHM
jgi:hypothetical protein